MRDESGVTRSGARKPAGAFVDGGLVLLVRRDARRLGALFKRTLVMETPATTVAASFARDRFTISDNSPSGRRRNRVLQTPPLIQSNARSCAFALAVVPSLRSCAQGALGSAGSFAAYSSLDQKAPRRLRLCVPLTSAQSAASASRPRPRRSAAVQDGRRLPPPARRKAASA